jgi:hypothetical protein
MAGVLQSGFLAWEVTVSVIKAYAEMGVLDPAGRGSALKD